MSPRKDYLSGHAYGTTGAYTNALAALAHAQRHTTGIADVHAFIDGYWDATSPGEGCPVATDAVDRWASSLRDTRGT